jgi:hypothetical protein
MNMGGLNTNFPQQNVGFPQPQQQQQRMPNYPYNYSPGQQFQQLCNNGNYQFKNKDKKKKVFEERAGDWVCMKCKNLNFSFRIICNRCKIPKMDSEKLYEDHMKNLYNYVKINEMYQNQVFSQPSFNSNQGQMYSNPQNQAYNNGFYGNTSFNPQLSSNQNCINLNVYSKESLNNGNGYN